MLLWWFSLFCAIALAVVLLAAPWRRGDSRAPGRGSSGGQDGPPDGPEPGPARLLAGRVVVALTWAQCVAAVVVAGYGGYYALQSARPDNRSELAELGIGIGVAVTAVGLIGAAAFAALGTGLRRRYRQVRHVFAAVQGLILVGVLQTREAWSWPAAAYLVASVALGYVGDVENAAPAPSPGVAAAAPGRDDDRGGAA